MLFLPLIKVISVVQWEVEFEDRAGIILEMMMMIIMMMIIMVIVWGV
jgi:hypothetical protein